MLVFNDEQDKKAAILTFLFSQKNVRMQNNNQSI